MIADFVLITIICLFAFLPERMIPFSNTALGRLLAVATIVYYSKLDRMVGLLFCMLIIYFYQTDEFDYMLNVSEGFLWDMTLSPYDNNVYSQFNNDLLQRQSAFRSNHCIGGKLTSKGVAVRADMTEHVFPEVEFDDAPCNPCNPTCRFSILVRKLDTERELMRPVDSNAFFGM
jgi:hypothetical protein